jgi:hypothetical protein
VAGLGELEKVPELLADLGASRLARQVDVMALTA